MSPQPQQCQAIAEILCAATEQILWRELQPWLAERAETHHLRCRVGSGEATYYRLLGHREHLLNYGRKMVASKFDAARAAQWRTGREIVQRSYFSGELTLSTVLAHTCCHEFGHIIQSIKGWIRYGSIHNREFYRILDRIHHSDSAQRVHSYIEQRAADQGLPLSFIDTAQAIPVVACFQPGELVCFEYRGRSVVGEVLRVNRKTVNVKPVTPRLAADYFRISPHFLTPHH
jgi:hypothetical protein